MRLGLIVTTIMVVGALVIRESQSEGLRATADGGPRGPVASKQFVYPEQGPAAQKPYSEIAAFDLTGTGNLVLAGYRREIRKSQADAWVAQLDPQGNQKWVFEYDAGHPGWKKAWSPQSPTYDRADKFKAVAITANDEVIATGGTFNVPSYHGGPSFAVLGAYVNTCDLLLVRLSAEGKVQWKATWRPPIGPGRDAAGACVAVDPDTGSIYVAGVFAEMKGPRADGTVTRQGWMLLKFGRDGQLRGTYLRAESWLPVAIKILPGGNRQGAKVTVLMKTAPVGADNTQYAGAGSLRLVSFSNMLKCTDSVVFEKRPTSEYWPELVYDGTSVWVFRKPAEHFSDGQHESSYYEAFQRGSLRRYAADGTLKESSEWMFPAGYARYDVHATPDGRGNLLVSGRAGQPSIPGTSEILRVDPDLGVKPFRNLPPAYFIQLSAVRDGTFWCSARHNSRLGGTFTERGDTFYRFALGESREAGP